METREISNQLPGDFPKIAGYEIKERLGKGGMAQVYLAFQEDLQREVAIKVLDPVFLRDEKVFKRFEYEAKTAAKLIHNNIVTIYNVGQSGDNHYIVMEYLKESLRDRLEQERKLSELEALLIIKKIADALFYAHNKGIIHRDIKPDNIMFRPDGTPVLVDFGIARIMDLNTRLTITGIRVGTPSYMSPEQCMGKKLDGRSDIYSLGVALFEILTGEVPYKPDTPTGIIYLHTQGPLPQFTGKLNKYQPLINKMMAKEKQDRVENGQALIKLIESLERDRSSIERNDSPGLKKSIIRWEHQNDSSRNYISLTDTQQKARQKKILIWPLAIVMVVIFGLMLYLIITMASKDDLPGINRKIEKNVTKKEELLQKPSQSPSSPDRQKESNAANLNKKSAQKPMDISKTQKQKKIKAGIPGQRKKDDEEIKAKKDEAQEKEVPGERENKIETGKNSVKSVNIVDLSREIVAKIDKELTRVEVWSLPEGIVVGGKIKFDLSVNENGNIHIKRFDDTWLRVNPNDKKEMVKNMISTKINSLSISPPRDESGQPIKIENWLKTFKVSTFRGKIILHLH